MSRIAKKPVIIPEGVMVDIIDFTVVITGPKGTMKIAINDNINVFKEDNRIVFIPQSENANAVAGTVRMLVNNMVIGVTQGFEKKLLLVGVGYKAQINDKFLNLSLGYSHIIKFPIPDGINIETPSQTEVILKGTDKRLVGQIAAKIRGFRSPEPYKGKGIRYENEIIVKKEGKKK